MSTVTAGRIASAAKGQGSLSRRLFEWGGIAAGVILIAFGIGAIVMGFNGRSTVADSLKQEQIVGSADMTPAAIKSEAQAAHLNLNAINLPTCSVANKPVANAARNVWVTETALTTALNSSYMAEQLGLFGIVVGVALLLSGGGFVVLAVGGALRHRQFEEKQA